jgi:hypothetical protein
MYRGHKRRVCFGRLSATRELGIKQGIAIAATLLSQKRRCAPAIELTKNGKQCAKSARDLTPGRLTGLWIWLRLVASSPFAIGGWLPDQRL